MPSHKRPVVTVDLDDVLGQFNEAFVAHHNRKHGTNFTLQDIVTYDLCETYQVPFAEILDRVRHFCHTEHHTMMPFEGAADSIERLAEYFTLHLVTSRCESIRETTEVWLREHGLAHFTELHFTNGYSFIGAKKRSKLEVCAEHKALLHIDDAPEHAESLANAGIKVVLMDRPWNQDVRHSNITRVYGWDEVVRHITSLKR